MRLLQSLPRKWMDGGSALPLWLRHNDHESVSNHQPHECLLNRLFRRRSKKTSKLRVTGLCVGNSPGPVNSPHKGPVTRKMFPFDDVIMYLWWWDLLSENNYGIQCLKARYLQGESLMDILYPLLTWIKFNSAYISNHTPSPVWYAITHPFQTAPLTFGMDK